MIIPERSRPLPELLDGEDWEVRSSGKLDKAYVDFNKREFVVPFHTGPSGELVRAHEAMHVKISPRSGIDKKNFRTFQAIEDARVHQGLRIVGIQTDKGRVFSKDTMLNNFAQGEERRTPLRLAEAWFATKGLAEEENIKEIIDEFLGDRSDELLDTCVDIYNEYFAENEAKGELTSLKQAKKAMKELLKRIKEMSSEQENGMDEACDKSQQRGREPKNVTGTFIPGDNPSDTSTEEIDVVTDEEREEIKDALPHSDFFLTDDGGEPGEMTVEKGELDQVIKFKKVASVKITPSDEGVIPSRMYRYATDMRVFSRKGRRRANAAVLIDISGSMSLSNEQIEQIIRLCPAAIVGVYCGMGSVGKLRIVAEKGRFTTNFKQGYEMGHSNIVDYPALLWLAKQKEKKKIWISDGYATGKNDTGLSPYWIRKIVNVLRVHKIERVGEVKELIANGKLIDAAFDDGHEIGRRMQSLSGTRK